MDLKMDDKNKGIHTAYIMVLAMKETKFNLVYEAVG
jgi:hypothetical protein